MSQFYDRQVAEGLLKKYQKSHDIDDRTALVDYLLPCVTYLCCKYAYILSAVNPWEANQEMVLTLIRACDDYDEAKKSSFWTYINTMGYFACLIMRKAALKGASDEQYICDREGASDEVDASGAIWERFKELLSRPAPDNLNEIDIKILTALKAIKTAEQFETFSRKTLYNLKVSKKDFEDFGKKMAISRR